MPFEHVPCGHQVRYRYDIGVHNFFKIEKIYDVGCNDKRGEIMDD